MPTASRSATAWCSGPGMKSGNNGYAEGIVRTHANYLIGCGPSLRMQTDNQQYNRLVETAWDEWCKAAKLRRKLWAMSHAKTQDGEAFGVVAEQSEHQQRRQARRGAIRDGAVSDDQPPVVGCMARSTASSSTTGATRRCTTSCGITLARISVSRSSRQSKSPRDSYCIGICLSVPANTVACQSSRAR